MVGEPVDSSLIDALEDGDAMVDGEEVFEFRRIGKATERSFENDEVCMLGEAGWTTFASNAEAQAAYDRKLALKVDSLIGFVRETQADEWAKLEKQYGSQAQAQFLKRVNSLLEPHQDRDGLVNVLRHGISMVPNAHFRLCYFKPASAKNPDAVSNYQANCFEVVRQLRYGTLPDDADNSVDVVLFLNGIPVVTMELKNNLSGQRAEHAVQQYEKSRSPKELLFKPNRRVIVHFALDSETVEMCTWLVHHLQSLHDAADWPVFDTVVVLTDRRNLDSQLS